MPSKSHSEFQYRFLVDGQTVWEKIKILKGFLDGRYRARVLEEVGQKKYLSKVSKLKYLLARKKNPFNYLIRLRLESEALELEAEIMELDSGAREASILYALNHEEIDMLERLISEAYDFAEPTRIPGYTDEQMFDANANNEFTVVIAKEIQAEIIANGRPSPAKIRNAMSNPSTLAALQGIGLIPADVRLLCPENITLSIGNNPTPSELENVPAQ